MRVAASPLVFKALWLAMRAASPFSRWAAGKIAARIWFTPWSVDPGERGRRKQRMWLRSTRPVTYATSHGTVRGFEAGAGPTVLLVHGWGDTAASMGAFIAPLAAAGYRIVGIDLPGHGDSDSDDVEPNAYAVAHSVGEVCSIIGDVRSVIAHSFGALATTLALRDGLQVSSVVLISPSSRLDRVLDTFVALLKVPPRAESGFRRELQRRFGESVWDDLSTPALSAGVTVSALVLHDREDPQVAFEDSERLVETWPNAVLVPTTSLGHGRILRDEDVIAEVLTFLGAAKDQRDHANRYAGASPGI